jgi:hypothetical protein
MTVSQVIEVSDSRPGSVLETSGKLFNNSDSWAPIPEPLCLKFWEWGQKPAFCKAMQIIFMLGFGTLHLSHLAGESPGEQISMGAVFRACHLLRSICSLVH